VTTTPVKLTLGQPVGAWPMFWQMAGRPGLLGSWSAAMEPTGARAGRTSAGLRGWSWEMPES
jgi:hypothetical protein